MILLRRMLGEVLRRHRTDQHRTLRDVSDSARVSLGYLSEVERGQKEPSSELLASICSALESPLSTVLREASDEILLAETEAAMTGRRTQSRVLSRRIGSRLVVAPQVPNPTDGAGHHGSGVDGSRVDGSTVDPRLTGAAA